MACTCDFTLITQLAKSCPPHHDSLSCALLITKHYTGKIQGQLVLWYCVCGFDRWLYFSIYKYQTIIESQPKTSKTEAVKTWPEKNESLSMFLISSDAKSKSTGDNK